MSAVGLVLFFAAGSVASYAVHYFSADQKLIREFSRFPIQPIQDAPAGQEIRIVGTVQVDNEQFLAPFTQRPCVYYEATVEETTEGSTWKTIAREVRCASFFVQDKSARALVKSENLHVAIHQDSEFSSGFLADATLHFEAFLARHGKKSTGTILNRTLRYREGIFQQGEYIAILGRIRWEHDPNPEQPGRGYRDVPKRAVVEPRATGEVWVSDVIETWREAI